MNELKMKRIVPIRLHIAISKFSLIFPNLNDVVNIINDCYGFFVSKNLFNTMKYLFQNNFNFQVMICFGIFLVYTVFTCFALYRLVTHFNFTEFYFVMRNCYWNILFSAQIIFIIIISHDITSEGRRSGFIVHELLNMNMLDERTEDSLKTLSLQIRHMVPIVTCKAFTFDWTLVYSVSFVLL